MKDLQLTQINQRIDGELFEWWLHPLADGRIQAVCREPITGAITSTRPMEPAEFDEDLENLGERMAAHRRERILTVEDVEYHVQTQVDRIVVHWLDADAGIVRKARVFTCWNSPLFVPVDDILGAVNTPLCWID